MKRLAKLERIKAPIWIFAGAISLILIGMADILTGHEVSFSIFYLIPIFFVTWYAGKNPGIGISVLGALMWLAADFLDRQPYSQPLIIFWNTFVPLCFFVIVALLLPALKELEHEKHIARTDDLTGAANRRSFFEMAGFEIERSRRYSHPFTIAYIDLDELKIVNDSLGHRVGDDVLRATVARIHTELRKTDTLARLGGDEFALLLPETGQVAARTVISKLKASLADEMQKNHWDVTFSIGVMTCLHAQITTEELVKRADAAMYAVKKNGKNGVLYTVLADGDHPA